MTDARAPAVPHPGAPPQIWKAAASGADAGSDAALEALSAALPDMRIERTPAGHLVVMNPTKPFTGKRNSRIAAALTMWADAEGSGEAYDSSTGWTLPKVGSVRSPDASWLKTARWDALTADEQKGYSRVCPDFVIELLSDPSELRDEQGKMMEYMTAGARLGWLIDPFKRCLHVYRPNRLVEVLENPERAHGDPELPGFTLELSRIWTR